MKNYQPHTKYKNWKSEVLSNKTVRFEAEIWIVLMLTKSISVKPTTPPLPQGSYILAKAVSWVLFTNSYVNLGLRWFPTPMHDFINNWVNNIELVADQCVIFCKFRMFWSLTTISFKLKILYFYMHGSIWMYFSHSFHKIIYLIARLSL